MPVYNYECSACGDAFEHVQSMKSGSLRKCQKCKAFKLVRLISNVAGILFKGDGFYETDYKRNHGKYNIDWQRENVQEHDIQRRDPV